MGNFSRDTFDRLKHYVSVRLQQGVPIVDADWNELQDIRKHELETFLKWFVGNGVPAGDDGFAIAGVAGDNDFSIADGRCLVAGWDAVNDWSEQHGGTPLLYSTQPLFDNATLAAAWGVSPLPPLTTPGAPRTDTVYLDVWEREVGAGEDTGIVNPLIGIETSVRTKREWVVRVAEGGTAPSPADGHVHYPLARLNRTVSAKITSVQNLRRTGLTVASVMDSKVDRTGDQITGDLQVDGKVTINGSTVPALDVNASTTAVAADAIADSSVNKLGVQGTASGVGGAKYGVYGTASGDDSSSKYGVYGLSSASGGLKFGVYGSASGDGVSNVGLYGTASGAGSKYGLQLSVSRNDNDYKYGGSAIVGGDGGVKYGWYSFVSGIGGVKYGAWCAATGDAGTKYGAYCGASGTGGQKYGAYSFASGNDTDTKTGVYCRAEGIGGTKYGVQALAIGDPGMKIGVSASATGDDVDIKHGLYGAAIGRDGPKFGVYGTARGDGGAKYGVYGETSGAGGDQHGIKGVASGDGADAKYAVHAYAVGNAGTKYGLYARTEGAGINYAGYFEGDVFVSGTLTKGNGTFCIDHVLEPDNKVLRHSFVESPEDLCLYRGKVKLNASGKASVTMPDYFAALTKEEEATVLLTPVGDKPCLLSYVWQKGHTRLAIHGEAGVEVSYLVLANRDDPVIRRLRRPVEEDKESAGFERGKLLYPEAFGRPAAAARVAEPVPPPPPPEVDGPRVEVHEPLGAAGGIELGEDPEHRMEEIRKERELAAKIEREMLERARAKAAKIEETES